MVQANSSKVVRDEKIKAAMLNYLYEQPGHSADWEDLYEACGLSVTQPMPQNPVLKRLCAAGEVQRLRKGDWYAWYKLPLAKWLSITRSKQLCSNTFSSNQG